MKRSKDSLKVCLRSFDIDDNRGILVQDHSD
jgi:hypothetical protein